VSQQADLTILQELPTPQQVLADCLARHTHVALSFSGAEDVVLVDMVSRIEGAWQKVSVFSLDTGRLHPETYRYLERVREHYAIAIELLMPDPQAVADLVRRKGLFSFYRDGHGECCAVRKIAPLAGHLERHDAWITGQRRDQAVTRAAVPQVQEDRAFAGIDGRLTKYNPLAEWSGRDVWAYIRAHGVPFNPLHERGFVSIGCQPCTRPVGPHEHERAGRWWWEEETMKECGLHAMNVEQGLR
jgi:phosphoadenosine phosphosulfate reductase